MARLIPAPLVRGGPSDTVTSGQSAQGALYSPERGEDANPRADREPENPDIRR